MVLRRRWLALVVLGAIAAAGVARVLLVSPRYRATAQMLIEHQAPDVLDFEKNSRAAEVWDDFYQTQYRLLQSRMLARKAVLKLDLLSDPAFAGVLTQPEIAAAIEAPPGTAPAMEQAVDRFLSGLRVQPIRNSQLIALTFESDRPTLAARSANALAELYIQQTLDFRYRVSAEAGAWLDQETAEHTRKVSEAQRALQEFQDREGLGDIDERRGLLEQKLKDLGAAVNAAKTRRLDKQALSRQMQGAGNAEELPDVVRSPLVQSLRTELGALERQQQQLAQRYLEEHPEVVKVRRQVEDTRAKIAAEARRVVRAAGNDTRAAQEQEAAAAGALASAEAEAHALSRRAVKYDELKRDLTASQRLSESLLTRQKQTEVGREVRASNVHVIDAAVVPRSAIRPRPLRDLVLTAFLAIAGALAVAFVRDYFDGSVGKPSDVQLLGQSLLGVIPEAPRRRGRLTNGDGQEAFSEGYRVLRTALPIDDLDGGQVLLVTSTLAGEGKSLTALNLARTLSSAGERVLLVDADLRRPQLSSLLRVRREPGLSDLVTGGLRPDQAVHVLTGELSLLPAGAPVARNPADLLSTDVFRTVLGRLRGSYDRIVVDTPPVGAVADALVLAPLVDGVLVVARSGKVTRDAVARVLSRLTQARGRVLGIVLNRARPERHAYDYGPPFAPAAYGGARPSAALALAGPRDHERSL
ncbi:MAG: polysaccharide biosynthesis tyrosine autokinase [Vicinamibacteria bacterium]